jgi:hypothetical protein
MTSCFPAAGDARKGRRLGEGCPASLPGQDTPSLGGRVRGTRNWERSKIPVNRNFKIMTNTHREHVKRLIRSGELWGALLEVIAWKPESAIVSSSVVEPMQSRRPFLSDWHRCRIECPSGRRWFQTPVPLACSNNSFWADFGTSLVSISKT